MSDNNNQGTSGEPSMRRTRRSKQVRAGITLPVSRIHKLFREGNYASRYSVSASIYVAAVLEYVSLEILEDAGWKALDRQRKTILPKDLMMSIQNDPALNALLADSFGGVQVAGAGWVMPPARPLPRIPETTSTAQTNPEPSSIVTDFLRSKTGSNDS
ncbi:histone-fold-containing protein [Chlamydoabsidia padenii]|nr:histone-fold-containing protein [Chlamydoabsidia padenii]